MWGLTCLIVHARCRWSPSAHPCDAGVFDAASGTITDIGFGDASGLAIVDPAPKRTSPPVWDWISERSYSVGVRAKGRGLARIEIVEARVYDIQQRGEIDFTGLLLKLEMREDAWADFRRFVGEQVYPMPGVGAEWAGGLIFKMPCRPFRFPAPRGSADPWAFRANAVGKLKRIQSFEPRALEIVKLVDATGRGLSLAEALAAQGSTAAEMSRLHLS